MIIIISLMYDMLIYYVPHLFFVDCSSDFKFNHLGFFNVSNSKIKITDNDACACKCSSDTTCLAYHFNNVSSGCFMYEALGNISMDSNCSAYIKKKSECPEEVHCMSYNLLARYVYDKKTLRFNQLRLCLSSSNIHITKR